MTYQELLSTNEWKSKRYSIISQDNFICNHCNNKTYLKEFKSGEIIKGSLTSQIGDILNNKLSMRNTYKVSFTESNLTYVFSAGKSKPIYESTFESYNYFTPDKLVGLKVLYAEQDNKFIITSVVNDAEASLKWIYVRNLHVHHKYYQEGKKPWQYPNNALITLCWDCHEELHKGSSVPWRDEKGNIKGKLTNCSKCYGAGYIPKYSYYENGVCFKCDGKRFLEFENQSANNK